MKLLQTRKIFSVSDYHAPTDGQALATSQIQQAIDDAAQCGGKVVVPAGTYHVGSLFLKSGIEFHLEKDARLLGSTDESQYPVIPSRVAGVEMEWPAGVVNIFDQHDVAVTGCGMIDGQGPFWWNKYWGDDRKGGMRKGYTERGLRWAVDYDCTRPRNVIVMNCENILLSDFTSVRSGFWNVHLCYSKNIHVTGLSMGDNNGPSTDGIDVDSCKDVLVERCVISCNDDSVCIKSGRDADGLRVNRVCEDVLVRDCRLLAGSGITLGSETSGGIRNIRVENITYDGTAGGFRIKSARTRGGVIENIQVSHLRMRNVSNPIIFQLDWNPSYSYCEVPADYEGEIPPRWKLLAQRVDPEKGIPYVRNIVVKDVVATLSEDCDAKLDRGSTAFDIDAYAAKPMEDVTFEDIDITAKTFGNISGVKGLKWKNVTVTIAGKA